MKNYVQPGVNLTVPAPAAVLGGDVVSLGSIVGVAAGDATEGAELDLVTEGVFELPKVAALAISIGDRVYFDSSTKLVSKTASGNTLLGVAVTVAANPSAVVAVRLNGSF